MSQIKLYWRSQFLPDPCAEGSVGLLDGTQLLKAFEDILYSKLWNRSIFIKNNNRHLANVAKYELKHAYMKVMICEEEVLHTRDCPYFINALSLNITSHSVFKIFYKFYRFCRILFLVNLKMKITK